MTTPPDPGRPEAGRGRGWNEEYQPEPSWYDDPQYDDSHRRPDPDYRDDPLSHDRPWPATSDVDRALRQDRASGRHSRNGGYPTDNAWSGGPPAQPDQRPDPAARDEYGHWGPGYGQPGGGRGNQERREPYDYGYPDHAGGGPADRRTYSEAHAPPGYRPPPEQGPPPGYRPHQDPLGNPDFAAPREARRPPSEPGYRAPYYFEPDGPGGSRSAGRQRDVPYEGSADDWRYSDRQASYGSTAPGLSDPAQRGGQAGYPQHSGADAGPDYAPYQGTPRRPSDYRALYDSQPGFGSPEPAGQPGYPDYPDEELIAPQPWQRSTRQGRAGYYQPTRALPLPPMSPQGNIPDLADSGIFNMPRPVQRPAKSAASSIMRSSSVMAVGTLGSRLTGFLRTIALGIALGGAAIATPYNLANTLPNVVYNLALGGILTSVIVPLIVNAARRDADGGEGYDQRMFSLITVALLGITIVATAISAPLAGLYSGTKVSGSPAELHLTVIFAYFFIPQIFFYGLSSLMGAILNARGSFAAPMWTPIVNNVVVIGVLGLFVVVTHLPKNPSASSLSGTDIKLLGIGTTVGIVAQTVALIPALRKVGFRWQRRLDFRRAEVTEIGRMGGWMFCYIVATQVAYLVTVNISGDGTVSGPTVYSYAWLLFQLPYAVVGISVITALLPRMSAHASEGRLARVRTDFSSGVRLASTIVVPSSLVLAVLGPKLAVLFLAHGRMGVAEANYVGVVFGLFCLGLLPFTIFQLQLRVFYSLQDSKTPALIGLATMTVNIVANVIALHVLPPGRIVAGLGVGFGLANVLGTIVAWRILSRRLRGLDGRAIGTSLSRMHAATLPATLIAILISLLVEDFVSGASAVAFFSVVLGGAGAVFVYVLFARTLQVEELAGVIRTVRSRLGR